MAFLSSIEEINMELEAHLQMNEIILSAAKPMALKAAVLLNIPDIIAIHGNENFLSVHQIASYISASTNKPANVDYLFRILRLLASLGVFTEEEEEEGPAGSERYKYKYGLTKLSKMLVNAKKKDGHYQQVESQSASTSCAPSLLVGNDKALFEAYHLMHECVIEGCRAFDKAHGMSIWEYLSCNPESNNTINEGMAAHTRTLMPWVLKTYDAGFKSVNSLVDVGGGIGSAISSIVQHHPHIRAINYDLHHVIACAPSIPGVENVAGDMFEQIPPADVVFMKCVLHDWDDESCVKVLKKSYEATPHNGKVLIVDAIIDGKAGSLRQTVLSMDVLMMVYSTGGKERTEGELKELFERAGFKSYTVFKLPDLQSLIEVSK
uniref:TSA: Wollemia nobilis Ref_Wollemi_Transcript_20423_1287 transcribed RNA sequence n=1 Tax=Wollemia nobilis TaxID=56998 RepID=A0A0C9S592_9CONI